MPRATTFETQNAAQNADQQRTDFRSWNAQQQKLIEGQAEEKPLMIEDTKPLVQTRPNVPPPKVAAVPTDLSAPEVKDSVREWEQAQGVVAGADAQANFAQQNNSELLGALPTHVMSPTPLKARKETFQDRERELKEEEHHGLKDRIAGVAEGVKDRVEGIWEGAKHRGEDLKDKALNALHLQHHERQEKNNNQGMISDAEAVRIGKKFDISDDKDTLIEPKNHLLGDVKSFVSHKWHEFTHAEPSEEEREAIFRNAHETPEWQELKQEFEHFDDMNLRQTLQSRAFFEERRNLQLPPSPRDIPLQRREFVERREASPIRRFERSLSPREEPMLRQTTIVRHPARENVLYEPIGFQERSYGEDIRARLDDRGNLIKDAKIYRRDNDVNSSDLYARLKYDKDFRDEVEERERLRLARRHAEESGEGLFDGMRHFVQDKWDALVHHEGRVRTPSELRNSDIRNAEEADVLRYRERREVSPVRQTLRRAETETKETFKHAREDVKKSWSDFKGDFKDAKHWTAAKARNAREDIKEGLHDVKDWTKEAAESAEHNVERVWHKAEGAVERTVSGFEHALGADQTGPDIVQKLEMMDQENILDMESDMRVYGTTGHRLPDERERSNAWWNTRRQKGPALFGSAEPESFDVVFARPELEIQRMEERAGRPIGNNEKFWRSERPLTQPGFVEKPTERIPQAEKHWFWRSRSRSPSQEKEKMSDRFSHRLDDMEANVVEDIVAGAPVQRVSGEFRHSLHQNRAETEIPIRAETHFDTRERRVNEIPVHRESSGMLASMRDFVSNKWNSFTGHEHVPGEKFETTSPTRRGMNRFQRFENDVADRVELYEEKQIKKAQKDWDEGKTAKFHSHASRAHAAENIAEKLRGTEEKENRSPTTPITPGYPV